MENKHILNTICKMAEDNNQGLKMSTTILEARTRDEVSEVTFQVDQESKISAGHQRLWLEGDYMCCAFFINRKELKKYK